MESKTNKAANLPVHRSRSGRFQISIWRRKKVIPAKHDFDVEREVEITRACIQYGRKNRISGEWQNQSIWCSPDELRSLATALDELDNSVN